MSMMMDLFIKKNIFRIVLGVAGSWENKDMKIDLIKLKFNDTYTYKYKPFTYCCGEIQNNKAIVFTGEDLVCNDTFGLVVRDSDDNIIPQFCNSYTETFNSCGDEWEQTYNYPIQFCPHCGEKIEISAVDEIDVSDKYNELSKQREELWRKCQRTDSKKEESGLRKQVRKLDDQINDFYELGEWKGEY